jgi:predicted short-subunit dehydrogenase-like oxidoreductase (DUF2520 family)
VAALGIDALTDLPPSDLIFIATPDDAIETTGRLLAASETPATSTRRHHTLLHTSGALSSAVLSPLARAGFHTGSLHPLVSVSDSIAGAKALRGGYYCLEGDHVAVRLAGKIVKDLGGVSFSIPRERKALYHAAAVMASGHVITLFDLAIQLLRACGLDEKSSQRILLPLTESAIGNLKDSNSAAALTGTFSRGDVATVKRHLEALSQRELELALKVYKLLGLHAVELAETIAGEDETFKKIRELLS